MKAGKIVAAVEEQPLSVAVQQRKNCIAMFGSTGYRLLVYVFNSCNFRSVGPAVQKSGSDTLVAKSHGAYVAPSALFLSDLIIK